MTMPYFSKLQLKLVLLRKGRQMKYCCVVKCLEALMTASTGMGVRGPWLKAESGSFALFVLVNSTRLWGLGESNTVVIELWDMKVAQLVRHLEFASGSQTIIHLLKYLEGAWGWIEKALAEMSTKGNVNAFIKALGNHEGHSKERTPRRFSIAFDNILYGNPLSSWYHKQIRPQHLAESQCVPNRLQANLWYYRNIVKQLSKLHILETCISWSLGPRTTFLLTSLFFFLRFLVLLGLICRFGRSKCNLVMI